MVQMVGRGSLHAVLMGTTTAGGGVAGLSGDMSASNSAQPTSVINHIGHRHVSTRFTGVPPSVGQSLLPR